MTDCKGLERGAYFHPHFSKIVDEICAKYIKPKEKTLEPERVNKTVQGMRDRDEANRRENETIKAENGWCHSIVDGLKFLPKKKMLIKVPTTAVNIFTFRKANGFTAKPFDTSSQSQMISLDSLRILFP